MSPAVDLQPQLTPPPGAVSSPVSDWCQRWDRGKGSWRHPRDGGFDRHQFDVVPLPEATAAGFIARHHYATTTPATRFAWGLVTTDDRLAVDGTIVDGRALVGAAVLSIPMGASVLTNVFPDLVPFQESLELGRLVLTDTPANAESFFLADVYRQAAELGIRGVVSFADPMPRSREILEEQPDGTVTRTVQHTSPGHCGVVYQSLNARACGRSTPRTLLYVPAHGVVLSERMLSKIRLQDTGAASGERRLVELGARPRRAGEDPRQWLRDAIDDLRVRRVRHHGNWRYAWALGTPAQRRRVRIALAATRYPKPDIDRMPLVG